MQHTMPMHVAACCIGTSGNFLLSYLDINGRRYSYRRASIGFSLAALIAGSMPLMIPTKLRIAVDQISVAESM
jgi:hypothetical protein